MKRLASSLCFSLLATAAFSQKPALDAHAVKNWVGIQYGSTISGDGKYVAYKIANEYDNSPVSCVVKAVTGSWEKVVGRGEKVVFLNGGRLAVATKQDTLLVFAPGGSDQETIAGVAAYEVLQVDGADQLAYLLKNKTFVLRNMRTGKETSLSGAEKFAFSNDKQLLLLNTTDGSLQVRDMKKSAFETYTGVQEYQLSDDNNTLLLTGSSLTRVDRKTGRQRQIWSGSGLSRIVMNKKGTQLAFETEDTAKGKTVWYFREGADKASVVLTQTAAELGKGMEIDGIDKISEDGERIYFRMRPQARPSVPAEAVPVDVWSYMDAKLQTEQLKDLNTPVSFRAFFRPSDKKVTRLELENDAYYFDLSDRWASVCHYDMGAVGNTDEANWSKAAANTSYFLINTHTGERQPLQHMRPEWQISPDEQYVVLSDRKAGGTMYSYETATGKLIGLTGDLPIPLGDAGDDHPHSVDARGIHFKIWLDASTALIYDSYDFWKVDVTGKTKPVNVTNGYGRKNNITFRTAVEHLKTGDVDPNGTLLLSAFDNKTKDNGFYQIHLKRIADPELLSMGPYAYYASYADGGGHNPSYSPQKAANANIWVIQRCSASESPNVFVTKDFKQFTQLSNVRPELAYNWLTAELVNFKRLDGKDEQGVLYKPEDFDPAKKYPVIFFYYERVTGEKNKFWTPEFSAADMDIPWFVSRGYLVFRPDIHYTIGEPMESAYITVMGAVKHLTARPYVNGERMGIHGHSYGGYQTDYIVTRTNVFRAACGGAGSVNFISGYGSEVNGGGSKQFFFENHQIRMGTTLWDRPDQYINQSAVFQVNKVTTPILVLHNRQDGAVAFSQGLEWFTGLRRLGKRAWMLQYDGQTHALWDEGYEKATVDFTTRMDQFFDHYLKDEPAPKWMLYGIPASMKGLDNGLELVRQKDASGNWITPAEGGLLTPEEKAKTEALMNRKPIAITIK